MAAFLCAIVWFFYRKVLRLWWMYDDPFQLRTLNELPLSVLLNSGHFYGGSPVFTPLLVLSLKMDTSLFGSNASAFYAHHLASFAILTVLFYFMLRFWCRRVAAASAAVVAMLGAPFLHIVPLLMCRHYIEGAIFTIVAIILFVTALRRDSWMLAIASGAASFVAAMAKEFYFLLPFLLAALPEGNRQRRFQFIIPHVVGAAAYTAWRLIAVGFNVEPYGFIVSGRERATLIATVPFRLAAQTAGTGSIAGWALVVAVIACVAFMIVRLRVARVVALVGIAASFLPLIPLAASLERRFALPLWLLGAAAIAFLPRPLPRRGTAFAVSAALIAVVAFRVEWPSAFRNFMRMSDEARVLAVLGPDDIIRNPITPPTTILELQRLTGTRARAFYDDLLLCDPAMHVNRIFEYDAKRREVAETTGTAVRRACSSIVTKPLRVRIDFDRSGAFHWIVGPYTDGTWTFIVADGIVAYDVPPQGGFRRPGWDDFKLRVRYISPQGWRTYSPLLPISSKQGSIGFNR